MKENTQEKNLIEKNPKSIFAKIKNLFKRILNRKEADINIEGNENCSVEVKENNEFKEYIKISENEESQLLELQRKYRNGEIAQDDLTNDQIDALCNLYDKQIAELKIAIENTKKQIAECDKKIEKKNA